MYRYGCIWTLLCILSAAAAAQAPTVHEQSATSTARVERLPGNHIETRIRNSWLHVVYEFDSSLRHRPFLVTVTTDVTRGTTGEGVDPRSTVSFMVDDLSGPAPVRAAAYADPGAEGKILGERYAVATMPGCCAGATEHRVRLLANGRPLFTSTGPEAPGTTAWAYATSHSYRRWAAFNGEVTSAQEDQGILGTITYGSDTGPLSAVMIRTPTPRTPEDAFASYMQMTRNTRLVWHDPREVALTPEHRVSTSGDVSGDPDVPKHLMGVENVEVPDPRAIGTFEVVLLLDGRRLIAVPVEADRLDPKMARGVDGIVAVPATP